MPEQVNDQAKQFDPFESFRGVRDAYLDSLSKTLIEAVNSESYAQATGAMLDYALSASAPFREAFDKSMAQTLQQLSLPSRQDVAALAERFTNVELRLDDLDAKIDRVLHGMAKPRPSRDRKRQSRTRKVSVK